MEAIIADVNVIRTDEGGVAKFCSMVNERKRHDISSQSCGSVAVVSSIVENGFLQDVTPMARRILLAVHQQYVQEIKCLEMMNREEKEDKQQTELWDLMTRSTASPDSVAAGGLDGHVERIKKKKRNLSETFSDSDSDENNNADDNASVFSISSLPSCSSSLSILDRVAIADETENVISDKPTKFKKKKEKFCSTTQNRFHEHGLIVNSTNINSDATSGCSLTPSCDHQNKNSPVALHTGNITLYHKFLNYFQHFFNQHDALGLASFLFYPSCAPILQKGIVLWKGCFPKMPFFGNKPVCCQSTVASIASLKKLTVEQHLMTSPLFSAIIANFAAGKSSMKFPYSVPIEKLEGNYNRAFSRLPDSLVIFHKELITIKQHPITGDTHVYAPYTFLATIPSVNVKDNTHSTTVVKNVHIEITCCAVMIFHGPHSQIISMEEHCYRMNIENPFVKPIDLMSCFDINTTF